MSNNYRTNKPNPTSNFPVNSEKLRGEGAAGFSRVEEWLTPDRIKDEFLFGIPLVSLTTGQKLSDKTIKNIINRAAAKLETKCKIDVFPVQRVHREDFDRTKYLQGWNQLQLPFGN